MNWIGCVAAVVAFALASATAARSEATPALAATPAPYTLLEAGASSEQLSNARGVWQSQYVLVTRYLAQREAVYASLARDIRFGQPDTQAVVGAYLPLSPSTILNLETSVSPQHGVLPASELFASLEHRLAAGWGYIVSERHRSYPSLTADTAGLTIDRYWRHDRAGVSANATIISNAPGLAVGYSAFFTRYYGRDDESSLTFAVQNGREAENVGRGVLISKVTGASLDGVHWTPGSLAVAWAVWTLRQGMLYSRNGVQVGLRVRI